jgi:hypothetical protein
VGWLNGLDSAELSAELRADLLAKLRAKAVVSVPTAIPGPKLQFLPLYVDEWFGSPWVDAMSDQQYAWFDRLYKRSWAMPHPCFLPNEMNLLAAWARCPGGALQLQSEGAIVLRQFEETSDGQFRFNRFLLQHFARQVNVYDAKVEAGRETQRKRKAKQQGEQAGELGGKLGAQQSAQHQASSEQLEQELELDKSIKTLPPPPHGGAEGKLKNWRPKDRVSKIPPRLLMHASTSYMNYPRRMQKDDALVAFAAAIEKIAREKFSGDIEEAGLWFDARVKLYAGSAQGRRPDKDKIPYPASWANAGSYNDDEQEWSHVGSFANQHRPVNRAQSVQDSIASAVRAAKAGVGVAD